MVIELPPRGGGGWGREDEPSWCRRLADIVEAASDVIVSTTREAIVTSWNPSAERLLGYLAAEAIGRRIDFLVPAERQGDEAANLCRAAASDAPACYETVWVRKDGVPIDLEVMVSPLLDGCRAAVGSAIVARDITRRKHEAEARRWEEISRHMVAVQEAERHVLSAELHDRTSSNLAALRLTLGRIRQALGSGMSPEIERLMEDVDALLADTNQGIRGISAELRPPLLDYFGLRPALEEYARDFSRHTGVMVAVEGDYGGRQMPETELALFRIAQEALANSAKHARASAVRIDLSWAGERVRLAIIDDGSGFAPGTMGTDGRIPGLGLLVMRERAELAGGSCRIDSAPGQGTRVEVLI